MRTRNRGAVLACKNCGAEFKRCNGHQKYCEPCRSFRLCFVEDCDKPVTTRAKSGNLGDTYCIGHRSRKSRGRLDWDGQLEDRSHYRPSGSGHVRKDGYKRISVGDGEKVLEHRLLMEDSIGRELHPEETVHHKNGVRDDNTETNLELWASRHPKGQRVEDLIEFAKDILEMYDPTSLWSNHQQLSI